MTTKLKPNCWLWPDSLFKDVLVTILDSGMRPHEVFRMRWEDVNRDLCSLRENLERPAPCAHEQTIDHRSDGKVRRARNGR